MYNFHTSLDFVPLSLSIAKIEILLLFYLNIDKVYSMYYDYLVPLVPLVLLVLLVPFLLLLLFPDCFLCSFPCLDFDCSF